MNICCYFEKEHLGKLIQALTLLGSCNADSIGEAEKRTKLDVQLKDTELTNRFIKEHKEGFFLHSSKGLFDVSTHETTFSTVCFYPFGKLTDKEVISVLKACASAHAEFGYAADEDEYEYRNRIRVEFSGSEAEAWVGRNLSKYLSGLYYFTLLSRKQISEKSIDLEGLKANAISVFELRDDVVLLKFFENSALWEDEKDKIDQLCHSNKNIFYKDEVICEAQYSPNIMDFIMKTRAWD